MIRVVIDEQLHTKLHSLTELVELCDEKGRVLGRVVPSVDAAEFEGLEPKISKEELHRRMANKGKTYTTAEVLAHLEKL